MVFETRSSALARILNQHSFEVVGDIHMKLWVGKILFGANFHILDFYGPQSLKVSKKWVLLIFWIGNDPPLPLVGSFPKIHPNFLIQLSLHKLVSISNEKNVGKKWKYKTQGRILFPRAGIGGYRPFTLVECWWSGCWEKSGKSIIWAGFATTLRPLFRAGLSFCAAGCSVHCAASVALLYCHNFFSNKSKHCQRHNGPRVSSL